MKKLTTKKTTMPATPNGTFGPISALVVTFLAYLGSQIAAVLVLGGVYSVVTRKSSDEALNTFSNSTLGQFMFIVLAQIAILAILYWFVRTRKISFAEIGFSRWPRFNDVGYALFFGIGYFITTYAALGFVEKFITSVNVRQEQQIGFESANGPIQLAFVFLALVVFVPIAEETLVRGFLYSGLRRKLSRIAAALIASFLFGMAHLQLGSGAPPLYVVAIDTFILSIFLISLREKTGSLWAGMMVHSLKNGLAFLALFIFHVA